MECRDAVVTSWYRRRWADRLRPGRCRCHPGRRGGTAAAQSFAFNLAGAPIGKARLGCWAREANVTEFPVSTGLSGVLMSLKAGALRELHWHANAAEWAFIISGSCRITIIDPQARTEVVDFEPGDIWYFPRGHGHSIQATGSADCVFLLVFDSGYFSEYATFSLSDWIGHTPPEVMAKTLGLPASAFAAFPRDEVYFAAGPVPGPLPAAPAAGSLTAPALTHRYRLLAQKPRETDGVSVRIASETEFPICTTMTGALMTIRPGALRTPHWHPNADEWQYYLSGRARMTVFQSQGRATTEEFSSGFIGYVPRGCGHYIEPGGNEEVRLLVVFNSPQHPEITMASWMEGVSPQLLATNLGRPAQEFMNLRPSNPI